QLQIGSTEAWVWVAVEPIHRVVLGVYISRHRNMLVVESFLKSLIEIYGRHIVYSDGGTWYSEACSSLGLEHRLHSSYEKSLIERVVVCLKDRTEAFDDYYLFRRTVIAKEDHKKPFGIILLSAAPKQRL
ncbi:MAG: DDE-type integrase/transposase/recombinase, partial [Candidatus Nitrosopolaris sp.]